jgi:hypothetical protein
LEQLLRIVVLDGGTKLGVPHVHAGEHPPTLDGLEREWRRRDAADAQGDLLRVLRDKEPADATSVAHRDLDLFTGLDLFLRCSLSRVITGRLRPRSRRGRWA